MKLDTFDKIYLVGVLLNLFVWVILMQNIGAFFGWFCCIPYIIIRAIEQGKED